MDEPSTKPESGRPDDDEPSLSISRLRDVIERCDRFEADFQAGRNPTIEAYLDAAPEANRERLLSELLGLEVELRRQLGEHPRAADYLSRFPDAAALIALAFDDPSGGEADDTQLGQDADRTIDAPRSGQAGQGPTMPPGHSDLIGGRYRIIRFHARGNLGVVHVAYDTELNREVALKQIRPDQAHRIDSQERFLLEGEITGGLEHPGIVPVYSLGADDAGRPYYAMRFVRGETLRQAARKLHEVGNPALDAEAQNLELRGLLRRFLAVCDALHYAHSRNVLHRDLKPANILLGPHGETIVIDWGLAKPQGAEGAGGPASSSGDSPLIPSSGTGANQTMPGSVVGTLAYMSPEQSRGRNDPVGPWSDIFSLGATLYAMLTGQAPYEGEDTTALVEKVRACEFPAPRSLKPGIAPALEAICLKAMKPKPEDRYPTARTLADDLERWLADEPVEAYPEPFTVRAGRWVKRHRQLVTAAAVLLLCSVVGLAGLSAVTEAARRREVTLRTRAESAETVAIQQRDRAQKNFAMERSLVDEIITPLADHLSALPEKDTFRKQVATRLVASYRELLADPSADDAMSIQAALALRMAANIDRLLGADEPAGERYQEALQRIRGPAQANPALAPKVMMILVDESHWHMNFGRPANAEADLKAALIELDRAPADLDPASRRFYRAIAQLAFAGLHHHTGDFDAARREAQEAITLFDRPTGRFAPLLQAMARVTLGAAARDAGDAKAARIALDQAIVDLNKLCDQSPFDPDPAFQLAAAEIERAELLIDDPLTLSEARADCVKAQPRLVKLYKQHREVTQNRWAFMQVSINLAEVLLRDVGQIKDGLKKADQALSDATRILEHEPATKAPALNSIRGRLAAVKADRALVIDKDKKAAAALLREAIADHNAALKANPKCWFDQDLVKKLEARLADL